MIRVELSASEITIEPGGTAQLTITVSNNQSSDDRIALEIEGIDVEWYALPVPVINVAAGASECARTLFKIARSSESAAGTYPFLVRARSLETGEAGVQQASLTITPFSALQVELNPKRAVSTFLQNATTFEVSISNLGNQEETLDLYASDPDSACIYEFGTERVHVKAGHTKTVPLTLEPVHRPLIGGSRLYGFAVTARSVRDAYVSANTNGQLERRPLLSTFAAITLTLLLLGGIAFAMLRPRPVAINAFTASPMQVVAGDPVTLSWDIAHLDEGYISPGNLPVKTSVGQTTVNPTQTTTYVLIARGAGPEKRREVTVIVTPRPAAPKPKIVEFQATARRIHQGEAVTLSWKVEGANMLVLNPLGKTLEWPLFTSLEVRPEQTTVYELVAKGATNEMISKSLTVTVVPPTESIAEINYFRAKPDKIETGQKTTLSWSVDGALSVEIDNGVGIGLKPRDKIEVAPTETTTYTLRAIDNRGNISTRTVTVTVTQPEPTQPAESTEPPATTPPNIAPSTGR